VRAVHPWISIQVELSDLRIRHDSVNVLLVNQLIISPVLLEDSNFVLFRRKSLIIYHNLENSSPVLSAVFELPFEVLYGSLLAWLMTAVCNYGAQAMHAILLPLSNVPLLFVFGRVKKFSPAISLIFHEVSNVKVVIVVKALRILTIS